MRRENNSDIREHRGVPALPMDARDMITLIEPMATVERVARIRGVAKNRVWSVIPVLEGLSDPRNGAAIMRSCDAFGCHELHLVDGRFPFAISDHVSRCTDQWLEPRHFPDLETSAADLHTRGYKIYYADMNAERTPEDFSPGEKIALLFGNEHKGATPKAKSLADGTFRVPMYGMVESLNVSVAAAITLHAVCRGRNGELDQDAQDRIVARYLWQTVPRAAEVIENVLAAKQPG